MSHGPGSGGAGGYATSANERSQQRGSGSGHFPPSMPLPSLVAGEWWRDFLTKREHDVNRFLSRQMKGLGSFGE
eukprot:GSA25T00011002001.1